MFVVSRASSCVTSQGFEEPDLTGFATTDSESESISRRSGGSDRSRGRSRSRSRSRTPSPFGATIAEVIEEGLTPPASPQPRESSFFAAAAAAVAAGAVALDKSAVSAADGVLSGKIEGDGGAQTATGVGDGRTEKALVEEADLGSVGAIGGGDGGIREIGGGGLGGGLLPGVEQERADLTVPPPPACSSVEAAAQSPSAALGRPGGNSSTDKQAPAAASASVSAPGTGDGGQQQQHPSVEDHQSDAMAAEAEARAEPAGGNDARRTPTSVADSSNSDDVSDWDSGLRSPTPGASSGADGGGPGGGAPAAPPPLISRVSSAVFAGSPALETPDREDMMVCVQPDTAGGGGSGVAWAAGGHGRKPSSGPFLFKPVALTKEAMVAMKWDETDAGGAPQTTSDLKATLVSPGTGVAAPPPDLGKKPPCGAPRDEATAVGELGSDGGGGGGGGKKSTGGTVLLSKGDVAAAESGSGSASEAAASGEGAGEKPAVPMLAATKVSASVAAVASTVAGAGSRAEPRSEGRVQGMVSRNIYGGPTEVRLVFVRRGRVFLGGRSIVGGELVLSSCQKARSCVKCHVLNDLTSLALARVSFLSYPILSFRVPGAPRPSRRLPWREETTTAEPACRTRPRCGFSPLQSIFFERSEISKLPELHRAV